MRTTYVTHQERNSLHPGGRNDWDFPAYRWTGRDGIDSDAADAWFGSS